MNVYVGLDIGGTKLMAMALDIEGNPLEKIKSPMPQASQEIFNTINNAVREVSQGHTILGIGAAIGGPVDSFTGVVSPVHQPAWRHFPLKAMMESKWDCPFHVDVDTNVAAIGEYHLGGYSAATFLYITVSTGMGGGFLVDGKLYRGLSHPEVGHQAIAHVCKSPKEITCDCGLSDCLEGLISGSGIRRVYGKKAEHLNALEWSEVAHNLGLGLRNIAAILSPEVIVLGGGVIVGGGKTLIDQARETMTAHLKLITPPEVKLSCHGYETSLMGACYFAQGKHLAFT